MTCILMGEIHLDTVAAFPDCRCDVPPAAEARLDSDSARAKVCRLTQVAGTPHAITSPSMPPVLTRNGHRATKARG